MEVAREVIHYRHSVSGAGSDGLRFSHLQSIFKTRFGLEKFGAGIEVVWGEVFDVPGAFPP